jgi:hypothetical protein
MITGSSIIYMIAPTAFVTHTTYENSKALLSKISNSGQRRCRLVGWTSVQPLMIAV